MSYELAFVYVLSAFILVCWDFAGVIVGLLALFTFACAVRPADANKASKPGAWSYLAVHHCPRNAGHSTVLIEGFSGLGLHRAVV